MILNFRHKGLEALYRHDSLGGVHFSHVRRLRRLLAVIDVATAPKDLMVPGFHAHRLSGALEGFWSLRVSGNWPVTFRFSEEDVADVDYWDHH